MQLRHSFSLHCELLLIPAQKNTFSWGAEVSTRHTCIVARPCRMLLETLEFIVALASKIWALLCSTFARQLCIFPSSRCAEAHDTNFRNKDKTHWRVGPGRRMTGIIDGCKQQCWRCWSQLHSSMSFFAPTRGAAVEPLPNMLPCPESERRLNPHDKRCVFHHTQTFSAHDPFPLLAPFFLFSLQSPTHPLTLLTRTHTRTNALPHQSRDRRREQARRARRLARQHNLDKRPLLLLLLLLPVPLCLDLDGVPGHAASQSGKHARGPRRA